VRSWKKKKRDLFTRGKERDKSAEERIQFGTGGQIIEMENEGGHLHGY